VHLAASAFLPLPVACERRDGHGRIDVCRSGASSVVTRAFAASPLKLLTPANHGHAAWVYTATYGGGMVDGDRLSMQIRVGDGAALVLATQASTKIYRSPRGTASELHADVGRDALCVIAPDPIVCFAASRYQQEQRFALADGAALVLIDWVTSGRRAAGERWAFDQYVARTQVRINGRLLMHDAVALRAADGDLARRFGRFEVLATLALIGPALRPHAAAIVAEMSAAPIVRHSDQLASAAALGDSPPGAAPDGRDGCVVRLAGMSVEAVGRRIRGLLSFLPAMLGDDPWSRKW
jgi:urease accessory protein